MRLKIGDKVINKINGRKGIIISIDNESDINYEGGWYENRYNVKYCNSRRTWNTIVEIEKINEILDEKEKEYLNNIIKPFKNSVVYITKMRDNRCKEVYEYIKICYIDIVSSSNYFILLPSFKEKTMYKNMIIDKEYNLMELNLE